MKHNYRIYFFVTISLLPISLCALLQDSSQEIDPWELKIAAQEREEAARRKEKLKKIHRMMRKREREEALKTYQNPTRENYERYKEEMMDVIPILGFAQTSYRDPLVQAVIHHDFDFILFLLEHGAKISFRKNEKSYSAFDVLRKLEQSKTFRKETHYSDRDVLRLKWQFLNTDRSLFTPKERKMTHHDYARLLSMTPE